LSKLSVLDLSMLDFEMAVAAELFVGQGTMAPCEVVRAGAA